MKSKSSSPPTLAVVTPCFNSGDFLEAAVSSVAREFDIILSHIGKIELLHIIVDDSSDDEATTRIFDKYKQKNDQRILILHNSGRRGPASARNFAIRNSSADWFAFLDADDQFEEGGLLQLLQHQQQAPLAYWIVGEVSRLWPDGQVEPTPLSYPDAFDNANDAWAVLEGQELLRRAARAPHLFLGSMLVHKRVFETAGLFNEDFLLGEDWWFALNAALTFQMHYTRIPVLRLRRGHDSLTQGSKSLSDVNTVPTRKALHCKQFQSIRRELRWTLISQLENLARRCLEANMRGRAFKYRLKAWLQAPWDVRLLLRS